MAFNFGRAISANLRSVSTGLDQSIGQLPSIVRDPVGKLKKGAGKGTLGHWVDQIYGGTFKEMVETAQGKRGGKSDDPAIKDPTLRASQIDPEGELGALQDIRKKKQGRAAANLSPASGASILTGPR